MQILEIAVVGALIGVCIVASVVIIFLFLKERKLTQQKERIFQQIESNSLEVRFE